MIRQTYLIISFGIAVLIFLCCVYLINHDTAFKLPTIINDLLTEIRGGKLSLISIIVIMMVVSLIGVIPASAIAIATGAIYGVLNGFLLAAIGLFASSVVAFFLSRSFLRPWIVKLLTKTPRLNLIDRSIITDGWRTICLLRLSPIMPFAATTYLIGLSGVSVRDYLIGNLAFLPALFLYVLGGSFASSEIQSTLNGEMHPYVLLNIGLFFSLLILLRIKKIMQKISKNKVHKIIDDYS